jgi:hypothetical protein
MAFGKLQFTFFRIYKICNWSCRPRNEERKIKNGHRPITDRYHFRASSLIVITSSKLNSPEQNLQLVLPASH